MRLLPAILLVLPLTACNVSVETGGSGDSKACDQFVSIATTIESDGPSADVADQLQQISQQATDDGQGQVAQAAQQLISAKQSASTGDWYTALGAMQAACGPFGD